MSSTACAIISAMHVYLYSNWNELSFSGASDGQAQTTIFGLDVDAAATVGPNTEALVRAAVRARAQTMAHFGLAARKALLQPPDRAAVDGHLADGAATAAPYTAVPADVLQPIEVPDLVPFQALLDDLGVI